MPQRGRVVVERLTGRPALAIRTRGDEVACRFEDGRLESRYAFELEPASPRLGWLPSSAHPSAAGRLRQILELIRRWRGPARGFVGLRAPRHRHARDAEKRAEALLLRHLTPEQGETYRRHGWFQVRGRDGSLWTIRRMGSSSNVERTTSRGTQRYCTYLEDTPQADTLLVQKLCIEATGGVGLPRTYDGVTLYDGHLFKRERKSGTGKPSPA